MPLRWPTSASASACQNAPEVTHQGADLVLADDAYPTVVTAIAAGRKLSEQLRRVLARAAALTHAASDGTTHRGKVSRQRGCPHRHPGSSRARPPVSGRARGGRGRCVERPPAD